MPSEPDLASWVSDNAVHLDPENVAAADVNLLSGLDEALGGKRFAFVGESNHFIHEKYGYRILLARYLVSRGFRVIGEELSWSDGIRVGRYLDTGNALWLDRVTAYGYRGDERDDRDDTPTGLLDEGWGKTNPAFVAEQVRWADALRELGNVRFFGFDVDYQPPSGYLHVYEWLEGPDADLRSAFERVPGESIDDEHSRLTRACELVDEHRPELEAQLGSRGFAELARSATTLRDSHRYAATSFAAKTYEELRAPMALRETVMCSHVDHVIGREGPGMRIALFSHNLHLSRDDSRIGDLSGGVGPGGGRTDCLGTYLAKLYPDEVFAIWMLEHEGNHSSPMVSLGRTVEPAPGTLNADLAGFGEAFVVPTRSMNGAEGPFDHERYVVMMHGSRVKSRVAEQADAVFFQRRVSPLRS
ncbi:MAG: erythromycin esterase family protein [Actinomycetota bacterium]